MGRADSGTTTESRFLAQDAAGSPAQVPETLVVDIAEEVRSLA